MTPLQACHYWVLRQQQHVLGAARAHTWSPFQLVRQLAGARCCCPWLQRMFDWLPLLRQLRSASPALLLDAGQAEPGEALPRMCEQQVLQIWRPAVLIWRLALLTWRPASLMRLLAPQAQPRAAAP